MTALPIISIFYPQTTDAGDFRGKIIYSTDNVDDGDKIDLLGSTPLRNIDIQVLWSDNFNNIYPLKLLPGKQVSMRLCFIRKRN